MLSTNSLPRDFLNHIFLVGKVPTTSLQYDPCFSYALYVPDQFYLPTPTSPKLPLVIAIHGSRREYLATRDSLIPLADAASTTCAILAPLFPCGITGPTDLAGYKQIIDPVDRNKGPSRQSQAVRYDQLLLAMAEEVAQRYPGIDTAAFFMTGFSGGGQFVHRFLYLHPRRVIAASVGAPGDVTLLDPEQKWPRGVSDLSGTFSDMSSVDHTALRKIMLQILVGVEDTETKKFAIAKLLDGKREDERTAVAKARGLFENWQKHALNVRIDLVTDVGHSRVGCHTALAAFLSERLVEFHARPRGGELSRLVTH